MQCLKCGREIGEGEVFCGDCLAVMEANPVKPGTPVVLPRREEQYRKATVRSQSKPEETIRRLERIIRRQRIILACLALVFAVVTGLLCWMLHEAVTAPVIGSNYSTVLPSGDQ